MVLRVRSVPNPPTDRPRFERSRFGLVQAGRAGRSQSVRRMAQAQCDVPGADKVSAAVALLLGLLVGYLAGLVEGAYRERRRLARLITALTDKGTDDA